MQFATKLSNHHTLNKYSPLIFKRLGGFVHR